MSECEAADVLAAVCADGDREPGGEDTYLATLQAATTIDRVVDALRVLGTLPYTDETARLARRVKAIEALKACPAAPSSPVRLVDSVLPPKPASSWDSEKSRERGRHGLETPEPWPEVVCGERQLDDLESLFNRYVVLPPGGAVTLALWTLYTYVFDAFDTSPLLVLSSPEKRCGKTRTLTLLAQLCRRPVASSNISPAVLYRLVEAHQPTLFVDEAGTVFGGRRKTDKSEELRSILDSGHTRSMGYVWRCDGDTHEARRFSTWSPKAIALIGRLPDTLEDRAVIVPMRRKRPGETVERFRVDRLAKQLLPLRQKAIRWAADHEQELRDLEPDMPAGLDDRAEDNWRPLLALADCAGSSWPSKARDAIRAVTAARPEREEASYGLQLLADIRDVFEQEDTDNVFTATLLSSLVEKEERPWGTWRRTGRSLDPRELARLVKPFGICSQTVRIGAEHKKGYRRSDFEDAWDRYLPPSTSVTAGQSPSDGALRDPLSVTERETCHAWEQAESSMTAGDVTVSRQGTVSARWHTVV